MPGVYAPAVDLFMDAEADLVYGSSYNFDEDQDSAEVRAKRDYPPPARYPASDYKPAYGPKPEPYSDYTPARYPARDDYRPSYGPRYPPRDDYKPPYAPNSESYVSIKGANQTFPTMPYLRRRAAHTVFVTAGQHKQNIAIFFSH